MGIPRVLLLGAYPLCAAAVTALSLMPLPPRVPIDFDMIDKVEHGIAYLALGLFGSTFFEQLKMERVRAIALSIIVGFALGVAIERIQILVGRSCEFADALVDFAGLILGSALYWLFAAWNSRRRSA